MDLPAAGCLPEPTKAPQIRATQPSQPPQNPPPTAPIARLEACQSAVPAPRRVDPAGRFGARREQRGEFGRAGGSCFWSTLEARSLDLQASSKSKIGWGRIETKHSHAFARLKECLQILLKNRKATSYVHMVLTGSNDQNMSPLCPKPYLSAPRICISPTTIT